MVENNLEGSKFLRTVLTIVSVLLIFAGPTYGFYVLSIMMNVNFFASFTIGIILFGIGLTLFWHLMKNKIIS